MERKILECEAIARAFMTKAVYTHPFTRSTVEQLNTTSNVRRICEFEKVSDIPSEATFSRAFEAFAKTGLGERVHLALVEHYLKPELVGHFPETQQP
jgi:hypothetical protein